MKTILTVDLSAVFWRAAEVTGPETPINTAMRTSLEIIRRIEGLFTDAAVVICCDSKSNWRKKVDETYKANRERKPDGFYQELERTKERLRKDGYCLIEKDGYEADDVIASIVKYSGQNEVVICSPDKDLLQLVGESVSQLRTHEMYLPDGQTLKLWKPEDVADKFGVLPHKLRDWLAITGDVADNVPGIEGIGGRGAAAILAEFGSLNVIFTLVEAWQKATNRESFNPFGDRPSIKRWLTPLTNYFLNANSDKAIARMSRNVILASLKAEVEIKLEDILKPRVEQPLTQEAPEMESEVMETIAMPPEGKVASKEPAVETKSIAKIDPMSQFNESLQPTGMGGLWWLANRAVNARLYEKFGSPERALMAMGRGADFGMSPFAAMERLMIVEGKICPGAQDLVAMVQKHPQCAYFYVKDVNNTPDKASATAVCCRILRNGKDGPEQTFTYTIEDAKRAKLVKPNSGWDKNPGAMCVARASSWLARWAFPDATTGAYSWEEMEGER